MLQTLQKHRPSESHRLSRGFTKVLDGHADESMDDLYDKIKEDVEFRKEWAERCGFGFNLPPVVPNVPKKEEKTAHRESRLSYCF